MKIKLGDKVRDIYTGFKGIAMARTSWLHGCDRIGIEPDRLDKDGKTIEYQWFDEQRVEKVKAQKIKISKDTDTIAPGGPRRDPKYR